MINKFDLHCIYWDVASLSSWQVLCHRCQVIYHYLFYVRHPLREVEVSGAGGGGNFIGGFLVVVSVFVGGFLLEGHVDIGFKMTGTLYWKDSAPF